ncbi:hypothetical protein P3T76_002391 [Phytophthora citrophthora]|uniref:RxLR effector protein n=1 Tax=Phytophthora citrophthora TaxID=4793 RepID=A0AAD9LU64_9STRA|nr:hypothetical protein P3T76_002391 [Phytophthora citrophthora]
MRSLFLVAVFIAVNNFSLTSAIDGGHKIRHLKGVETTNEEVLNAEDEERGWQELASKFKAGQLDDAIAKMKLGQADDVISKLKVGQADDALAKLKAGQVDDAVAAAGGTQLKQAAEKLKAQKALEGVEKAAGTATTSVKAKWQSAFAKLKAGGFKNLDDVAAPAVDKNKWQSAVAKIQSGQLNNLDSTNNKWQKAVQQMKAAGQLKNADEAQIVKITEGVAKEIAQAPEKSSKFKKFLEITFGVAITGLILYGFDAMVYS